MKKLICVLVAALAVGCGDERGKNGEKEDPLVRFYYDFDFDSLPEKCIKYYESNHTAQLLDKYSVKAEELFISEAFIVDQDVLIQKYREEAEQNDVVIVVDDFSVYVVFDGVSNSYSQAKFVLREHKGESVIEVETVIVDKDGLQCVNGSNCSGRVPFKSFAPKSGKTHSILIESDGDFELSAKLILYGIAIDPECL